MKTLTRLLTIALLASLALSCNEDEVDFRTRELPGNWIWTSSCGGFSGLCSYPDEESFRSIQITSDRYVAKVNGAVTVDETYVITKKVIAEPEDRYEVNYELTLGNGTTIRVTLFQRNDTLTKPDESGLMFTDYYRRQ